MRSLAGAVRETRGGELVNGRNRRCVRNRTAGARRTGGTLALDLDIADRTPIDEVGALSGTNALELDFRRGCCSPRRIRVLTSDGAQTARTRARREQPNRRLIASGAYDGLDTGRESDSPSRDLAVRARGRARPLRRRESVVPRN